MQALGLAVHVLEDAGLRVLLEPALADCLAKKSKCRMPNAENEHLETSEAASEISYEMLRKRHDPSQHAFLYLPARGATIQVSRADLCESRDRFLKAGKPLNCQVGG